MLQNLFSPFSINPKQAIQQPNQQAIQNSLNSECRKTFLDFKKKLKQINGADLNQNQMESLLSTTLEIQRIIQQNKLHQQLQKVEYKSILKGLVQKDIHKEIDTYQKDIADLTQENFNLYQTIQEQNKKLAILENRVLAQTLSTADLLDSFETNIINQFEYEQVIKKNEEFQTIIQKLTDKQAKHKGKIRFLKQERI